MRIGCDECDGFPVARLDRLISDRRSDDKGISIVQAGGLNVWVRPRMFCWRDGNGGYVQHPLGDLQEVVEQLVRSQEPETPLTWPPPAHPSTRRSM